MQRLIGHSKSQLAIEFAYRMADSPAGVWVFWIHAATKARVQDGFQAIADTVKLAGREQPKSDIPQLVHSWMCSSARLPRRWCGRSWQLRTAATVHRAPESCSRRVASVHSTDSVLH